MTKRQFLTLLVTIIGSGIVLLDGTVVNLALPALNHDMHANFSDLQWVVDGYLLSLSSLILLGGSLGDILGRKRVYITGLIGFGVVSALCGLAGDPLTLILLRILQGVFGALVVPGGLAIIRSNFPVKSEGKAIGTWAAWSGIATVIGPFVGGYLIDTYSWRWIFFLNVPFVVVCVALAVKNIRESQAAAGRRIDYLGALLALLFLASLTFGLIEGPARHWDALSLGAVAAGVALLGAFIAAEARKRDPMVPLRLFASRNFTAANIMTFAMYGALSGFFFAYVIYLQTALHYSSLAAGLSSLPVTFFILAFSGRIGGLASKYGARLFMTVGPLLAAAGMVWLLQLHEGSSYIFGVLPGITLFGAGMCILVAPLTVTVMTSVHEHDSGIASGINNAVSRAAGLIVIALLGVLGGNNYRFSVALCAGLAAFAGVISFILVQSSARRV